VQVAARRLLDAVLDDDLVPAGFAMLLAGGKLSAEIEPGLGDVMALAKACETDDPGLGSEAAAALVGMGIGLTPSGDDLLGGFFYALVFRGRVGGAKRTAWDDASDVVAEKARRRSHPISAVLLADLLRGEGHAPLHRLAALLSNGGDDLGQAVAAVRELVRVGNSSGWNMLAGFAAGLLGRRAFPGRPKHLDA
jgi:hypothetical protein